MPALDPLILKQQQLATTIDHLLPPSPTDRPRRQKYRGPENPSCSDSESCEGVVADSDGVPRDASGSFDVESVGFDECCDDAVVREGEDEISRSGGSLTAVIAVLSPPIHHLCSDDDTDTDSRSPFSASVPVEVESSTATPLTGTADTAKLQPASRQQSRVTPVEGRSAECGRPSVRGIDDDPMPLRNEVSPKADTSTAVETKVVPMVTIPFHGGPKQTKTTTAVTTVTTVRGGRSGGGVEVECVKDQSDCDRKLDQMMKSAWFPSNLKNSSITADRVCDNIGNMQSYMCCYIYIHVHAYCTCIYNVMYM